MSLNTDYAQQPTGSRRLTLTMLAARDRADRFEGAPQGTVKPLRYLAAFQEAEPYLGLPPQAYKLVAWFVKQTMPQDWEQGSRPICWPSAARQAEFLGLSPARVKVLNRALFEAGILIIRDSETGKRYGRRDVNGRIIEAYGFDLSPLAYRYEEFVRLAAEAKLERERMRALKRRATCARRAIAQAGETLTACRALPSAWSSFAMEVAALVDAIRRTRRSEDLALIVQALESRRTQAENWLREVNQDINQNEKIDPEGLVSEPHTISTNKPFNPKDTVIASEDSSRRGEPTPLRSTSGERQNEGAGEEGDIGFKPFETIEKLLPGELVMLAPRLADHLPNHYPDWRDIVDAAGGSLRHDLGVSQPLWGEACRVLGRPMAAVALAVVSTKPPEHFTRGAGGYFAAMIKRAEKGELHLDRSLWKLRREKWDRAGEKPSAGQGRGAFA